MIRSIEAHGGERFEDRRLAFRLCSASGCFSIQTETRADGHFRHRVEGATRDGLRRVVHDNDSLQASVDGRPLELGTAEAQRFADWAMERIYFPLLPYRLANPSVRFVELGPVHWGDRELERVEVTFEPGTSTDADDRFVYWIDPETAELAYFAYRYDGGWRFRQLFNRREIGGILFFDQKNYGPDDDDEMAWQLEAMSPQRLAELRLVSTVTVDQIRVEAPKGS